MSMAFWKRFGLPSFRLPRWPTKRSKRPRGFEAAADEKLAFWSEKVPLTMAMIAQALVITRWYIGREAPASVGEVLVWANVVIAIFAGVAIDLVMVTTVMARRKGRRGIWGVLTAASAAVASALIALDVYGGWTPGPYLHIAYPVVVFLFAMHLSSPRLRALNLPLLTQRRALIRKLSQKLRSSLQQFAEASQQLADLRVRFADLSQRFADASQQLADLRARFAHRDQDAAHEQQRVADRDQEIANLRNQLAHNQQQLAERDRQSASASREVGQLRNQLADRDRLIADLSQPLPDSSQLDLLAIAELLKDSGVSWARIAGMLNLPESTLRSRLKARGNGHLNGVAG